jgi:hypothetical protein
VVFFCPEKNHQRNNMDYSAVLAHLQGQFPGRLVLYVADIATILNKSEKAVANLITRDGLPFQIKVVGRLRCVDIFQVAQWLSTGSELIEEAVAVEAKPAAAVPPVKSPAKRAYSQIELAILQSRQGIAATLARFAHQMADSIEKSFIQDVARNIAFDAAMPASKFVLTLSSRDLGENSGPVWNESRWCLDSLQSVDVQVAKCREHASEAFAVRLVIRAGRNILFSANALGGIWNVTVNKAKLNFKV